MEDIRKPLVFFLGSLEDHHFLSRTAPHLHFLHISSLLRDMQWHLGLSASRGATDQPAGSQLKDRWESAEPVQLMGVSCRLFPPAQGVACLVQYRQQRIDWE